MIEKDIIFPIAIVKDNTEEINLLKSKEKSLKIRLWVMVLSSLLVIFLIVILSIFI